MTTKRQIPKKQPKPVTGFQVVSAEDEERDLETFKTLTANYFNEGLLESRGITEFKPVKGDYLVRLVPGVMKDRFMKGWHFCFTRAFLFDSYFVSPTTFGTHALNPLSMLASGLKAVDKDYSRNFTFSKREFIFVLVFKKNSEGKLKAKLQYWQAPSQAVENILKCISSDVDGRVLSVSHPVHGCKIGFNVDGEGLNRKYQGFNIGSKAVPLPATLAGKLPTMEELFIVPSPSEVVMAAYKQLEKDEESGELPPGVNPGDFVELFAEYKIEMARSLIGGKADKKSVKELSRQSNTTNRKVLENSATAPAPAEEFDDFLDNDEAEEVPFDPDDIDTASSGEVDLLADDEGEEDEFLDDIAEEGGEVVDSGSGELELEADDDDDGLGDLEDLEE